MAQAVNVDMEIAVIGPGFLDQLDVLHAVGGLGHGSGISGG
jgi:hypothetical protein